MHWVECDEYFLKSGTRPPSTTARVVSVTTATTPSRLQGRWTVDVDRERPALQSYVWNLRPSLLRWQFLTVLAVVALLLSMLILATGSPIAWVLAGILTALFVLVIVLRVVLTRILRHGLIPAALSATVVDVELDASAWKSSSNGTSTTFAWSGFDRSAVWQEHIILTKARKGNWLPQSIVYAPLAAFGTDAGFVPEYVARALSAADSSGLPSTSSGNDGDSGTDGR